MAAIPINLKVGERTFTTTRETLSKSGFFSALLSGPWEGDLLMDGSYFIDADPEAFQDVLRYLRHGTFPLFYDKSKGHDYQRYLLVLELARYFQIESLANWICDKVYLKAVKSTHKASEMEGIEDISRTHRGEMDVQYHPAWKKEQVYICPRNIAFHRGNPKACGKQCKSAQGDAEPEYVEELVLRTLAIEEEVVFDADLCMDHD